MSFRTPISQPRQASPPRGPIQRPDTTAVTEVETQSIDSQSSPVKHRKIPDNVVDIRGLPEATDKSVDKNFTRDHLSNITFPRHTWWNDNCDALVATIGKIKAGHEVEIYPFLCELLSGISERLYGTSFLPPREPVRCQ